MGRPADRMEGDEIDYEKKLQINFVSINCSVPFGTLDGFENLYLIYPRHDPIVDYQLPGLVQESWKFGHGQIQKQICLQETFLIKPHKAYFILLSTGLFQWTTVPRTWVLFLGDSQYQHGLWNGLDPVQGLTRKRIPRQLSRHSTRYLAVVGQLFRG